VTATDDTTLVDLLGETRAQVVEALRGTACTVAQLAEGLGVSEAAVRKHLAVLERDGLVQSASVRRLGPGRPHQEYTLTDKARRLYPDRTAEFATELLDYLEEAHGRQALLGFLRWRQARQGDRYASEVSTDDELAARVERLADLLSEDGFASCVTEVDVPEGATTLVLRQEHCTIADIARDHPELCAYEAAMFQQILGANISRRETIAGGATACVCTVTTNDRTNPTTGAPHVHEG
jgi:predicted ArsR family transcriptional regulator